MCNMHVLFFYLHVLFGLVTRLVFVFVSVRIYHNNNCRWSYFMFLCVCVCVLSHLHPCGETRAYKMVLWGVLTLWGNESLPHKE